MQTMSGRASFVQPENRELPTANIAITSPDQNRGREALGTARSIVLACIILATFRENAASTHRAKYYLGQIYEVIMGRAPSPVGKRTLR